MKTLRSLFFLIIGFLIFLNPIEAKANIKIACTDSDGGFNLRQEGEVTVTATHKDRVILQKSVRDRNWLSAKKYVEFYCDEDEKFPLYKLINCGDSQARFLPGGACPSAEKNSIMLEARHASLQPKAIVANPQTYQPYYNVSLTATAEPIFIKSLRFNISIGGLKKSSNVWLKFSTEENSNPIGNALLAWDQSNNKQATALLRFDQPFSINAGQTQNLTLWLQGLEETFPNVLEDNQLAVTIEDIELTKDYRIYYESKPRINRFESQ